MELFVFPGENKKLRMVYHQEFFVFPKSLRCKITEYFSPRGLLTLYPPRGGEISPPLEKMWYNSYVDLAKFFNSWWFFKLKPLTPYGEVIFLFWNQKCFKISYQIRLIPMIYESKIKKTLFSLVFWGKSYFFVMKLTFKYILAFFRGI